MLDTEVTEAAPTIEQILAETRPRITSAIPLSQAAIKIVWQVSHMFDLYHTKFDLLTFESDLFIHSSVRFMYCSEQTSLSPAAIKIVWEVRDMFDLYHTKFDLLTFESDLFTHRLVGFMC